MTQPVAKLKFGAFMGPFHPPNENPTLSLSRDLELISWLDELGFDEAWVGEHHSGGWETIASPEVFLATAAERTRHIRLGTGVVSLPYHHPYGRIANGVAGSLDPRAGDDGSWAGRTAVRRCDVGYRSQTVQTENERGPRRHFAPFQ